MVPKRFHFNGKSLIMVTKNHPASIKILISGTSSAMETFLNLKQRKIQRYVILLCYHYPENNEWTIKTRVLIVYLQLKFDEMQNDYLSQKLVYF